MSFTKLGEAMHVSLANLQPTESVLQDPDILNRMADDSAILTQFRKLAVELKQIAPKAKDFLYFSAIMMHAAEAALLDEVGNFKKDASGASISAKWESKGDSLRWVCSDPSVRPYKNSNNDIFPEDELIKAHKKWIGRPLCLDHKSSSVDMIRGVIVDTYYDRAHKRVIALCALDKVNYPDLARKVSTGYATSVSMGTAVGRAICSDCGNVARIEADFCDHMRKKSCYGEINIDLNPIELSIVVNGADPAAKIRHIVAAADSISQYVQMKKEHLLKSAEDETRDIELAKEINSGLSEIQGTVLDLQKKIEQLQGNEEAEQHKEEASDKVASKVLAEKNSEPMLDTILSRLEELDNKLNKLSSSKTSEETEMTNKKAYFQGGGGPNEPSPGQVKYPKEDEDKIRANEDKQMGGQMNTGPIDGIHPGYESFGESEEARKKRLLRASDEQKARAIRREAALDRAREALSRNESRVKESYWQGAGGVNEPTPNKVKYPKEDSDKVRDKEDKQQVGQSPFPGVGAVDGLHPSPESADVKDELKRKQMIQRAKLTAKFVKAAKSDGTLDLGESRWQVYADDKLILTATVNEITGKKSESLYGQVATKEFGRELLAKIKSEGFEKAASLYKGAQMPAAAPAAALPGPAAGAEPFGAPGEGAPGEGAPLDKGESGDPKEMIPEIINELQNRMSDLAQAWDALQNAPTNELKDFDQLGGEGGAPMATASSKVLTMQKNLSGGLKLAIKQTAAEINEHLEELKLSEMLVNDAELMKEASPERKATINAMVSDACTDAKRTLADTYRVMGAFVKYARGTQALIVKQARKQAEMRKAAQQGLEGIGDTTPQSDAAAKSVQPMTAPGTKRVNPANKQPEVYMAHVNGRMGGWVPEKSQNMYWDDATANYVPMAKKPVAAPHAGTPGAPAGSATAPIGEAYTGGEENSGLLSPQQRGKALHMGDLEGRNPNAATGVTTSDPTGFGTKIPQAHQQADDGKKDSDKKDADKKDDNDATVTKTDGTKIEMDADEAKKVLSSEFDLSTKEGRAAYRTKLAAKGVAFSDMIGKAHPKGGHVIEGLDTKPSGDLGKVETIIERHEVMLDIANAPPKVRKMAEEIQKFVVTGKINPDTDFEGLVAQGLDSDAVKYWKQYFGQAKDGGSEFAASMIKEYDQKKKAEDQAAYKVRVKRAYDLAYEMAGKDLIGKDASSINTQVNEILDWSDDNFDSLKKLVARQPIGKKASAMPQVGITGGSEMYLPAPESEPSDLRAALEAAFANKKY